jgi:DNA-binding transcriptional MerR regulator
MKKPLHQITLFETSSEATPPEENVSVTVVNTAPTPPLIIEITDDEPATAPEETESKTDNDEVTAAAEDFVVETADNISEEEIFVIPQVQPGNIQEPVKPEEPAAPQEDSPLPKRISSTRGRKSLKETAITADLIQIPEDEVLFSRQYYSIGEVATMFRENQSLIRYWETEFDILQPRKNKKGDRFFRPVDVKNLVLIYDLLRRRKFTIEGAKDFLKRNKKADDKFAMIQSLEKVKLFLLELRSNL